MDVTIWRHAPEAAASGEVLRGKMDSSPVVHAENPAETQARVQRHLAQCLQDASHSVYLAEGQDQALVGYAAVHWLPYLILRGPEGFVSELFVDQAARGQGVGVFSVTLGCFLNLSP